MSSTRSFRVISGPSTPTGTVGSDASLARVSIWSGTLKQEILLLGGTWPPVGTKTTSGCSATGATSQTKADSGDLVRRLIESSPGEQRRLWQELKQGHQTQQTPSEPPSSTITANLKRLKSRRTYDGNGHLVRSNEEVQHIEHLKSRRRTLLFEVTSRSYKEKPYQRAVLKATNEELFHLTEDPKYLLR